MRLRRVVDPIRRSRAPRLAGMLLPVPLVVLLAVASGGAGSGSERVEASTFGPAPRTPDGRFVNPDGPLSHGSFGVRFPFFLRRMGTAFRSGDAAPERIPNDGAYLRRNARHSDPTVTWIGHSTLLVQMDHVTFLTDPIWSDRPSPVSFLGPKRFVAPGVAFEHLPPIDFVVVSHNHYDHLDLPTLRALAERGRETRFFVPLGNGALLRGEGIERVTELDWGESAGHAGVRVHCLPAQHWSKRGLGDDQAALWASWAVTGPERRLYFAGDTGYFGGFTRIGAVLGPFDLAAVPIGAYEPSAMMREAHMNPEEAVRAAGDLSARRALAMHFGTFDLSDEPLDEPPRRFRAAAQARLGAAAGTSEARIGVAPGTSRVRANPGADAGLREAWVLAIGETRRF